MKTHVANNVKRISTRIFTRGRIAFLLLGVFWTSASFADPVVYTDNSLPAANITIGADGVEFQLSAAKTYDYTMSGTGSFYKTGNGTLTLSKGGSSFTGDVYINGGAIKLTPKASGSNSALGAVLSGRKIYVNSGAELILNNQDIFTNAHNRNPLLFVVDGGTISNLGGNYDYLTNITFKNGGQLNATDGNATWKAFKLHTVNVERSDRSDRSPATITAVAGKTNAMIAFGDASNTIIAGTSSSTVNVGEITSEDGSADDLSDLIISAVIADPVHTTTNAVSAPTEIVKSGAGTMELTAANTITGKTTISAGKIKLTGDGTLGTGAVVNNATLEFAHTSDQTSANVISGTGSVTKTGTGTLELKTINSSFTGNFTIDQGTVKVSSGSNADNRTKSALGASNVAGRTVTINKNGTLEFATTDVICDAHADSQLLFVVDGGKIKNSGAYYNFLHNVTLKNGANMYAANGNSTWEAYKIQNLNVVRNSDGSAASAVTLTAASVDHAVFTFASKSSEIATVPATIYVEDITSASGSSDTTSDIVISAKIVDPTGVDGKKTTSEIVKTGAGTLELKNTGNTFSGNLTINEGTVKVTAGSASNNRTLSAFGNGTVEGKTVTVNEGAVLDLAVENVIVNAHTNTKLAIVVDGGQIINSGYNYLQNLTLQDGAQVYAANGADNWKSLKFHNLSIVRKSAESADSPVTISADLTNPNATIAFGDISNVIKVGDNNSISTVTVEEITSADPSVNDNVSDLVISAVIANPLHTTNGTLSNATQIIKEGAGTMEFAVANTYTGMTTISAGTLYLSTANAIAQSASVINNAAITANSSQTLNNLSGDAGTIDVTGALTLNNDENTKFTGSITAASIEKTGDGTLKLNTGESGAISVENLTVTGGRLDLLGNATGGLTISNSVFSPGNSVGASEIGGGFTLTDDASVILEIGGSTPNKNDSLVASGPLNLDGGKIYLTFADACDLKPGDEFTAVFSGSNSYTFDNFIKDNVVSYYFTNLRYVEYEGKFAITGILDPNALPEPSAWVLLLLGAFGLMYWRKK